MTVDSQKDVGYFVCGRNVNVNLIRVAKGDLHAPLVLIRVDKIEGGVGETDYSGGAIVAVSSTILFPFWTVTCMPGYRST